MPDQNNDARKFEPDVRRPYFTGRTDLGHIIQAVVLLGSMGAGVVTLYIGNQTQLITQSNRITELERQIVKLQEEQKQFSRDIAGSFAKLSDQLIDLRILVAKGTSDGPQQGRDGGDRRRN